MKKENADDKVRKRIEEELDASFFVEAGAGSGKTKGLVSRMAALVRKGKAKIEDVAAVTFTRKAAAELRERFQIELEAALKSGAGGDEEKNVRAALAALERAFTGTIHSFCAKLLKERPVEAGIDPGFEEIEEDENAILAEKAWNEFMEKKSYENDGAFELMREYGVDSAWLEDVYMRLVEYPDVRVERRGLPKPDMAEAKAETGKFVRLMAGKVPEAEPEGGRDGLQETILKASRLAHAGYLEEDRLFIILLKALDVNAKATLNRWPDGKGREYEKKFSAFRQGVAAPCLNGWYNFLYKPLVDFAENGAKYYAEWRKGRSILNFQDLLTATAELLKKNPEVRRYFRNRIRYLLVDEFQDTDPIQAEIIMLLAGEDASESDWRKAKPAPGALFIVGDPKQSIYRFRRADIDIYNEVKRIFQRGAGEVVELTSNYRSLAPIGEFANGVFRGLFADKEDAYQAKFAPLVTVERTSAGTVQPAGAPPLAPGVKCAPATPAGRTHAAPGRRIEGVYENPIAAMKGNNAYDVAEIDAARLASWLKDCIASGRASAGDFMLITRTKKHLPVYASALEKLSIPYEISGGESFNSSAELKELLKVLNCLADPSNPVALVAALRGGFFGISDDDLYAFKKAGGRFSLLGHARLPRESGQSCDAADRDAPRGPAHQPPLSRARERQDGPSSVHDALARLAEYYQITREYPPAVAVEIIVEKLGIIPLAASGEVGATRCGNILKALEMLKSRRIVSTGGFAELAQYLSDLLAPENRSTESMSIAPGRADAVRLLNLHKAKGLEAGVVILADPLTGAGRAHKPLFHIKRAKDISAGYFVITKPKGEHYYENVAAPDNWVLHSEEEQKYQFAEETRKDYVAVTRAKNALVVSTYTEGTKAKAWGSLHEYLKEAPKLEVKKLYEPEERVSLKLKNGALDEERKKREELLAGASMNSYFVQSVTSEAKDQGVSRLPAPGTAPIPTVSPGAGGAVSAGAEGGAVSTGAEGGASWGRVVHRALELCGKGGRAELDALAPNWLAEEGRPQSDLPRLLHLADAVMKTAAWQRVEKAEKKFFEMPFSVLEDKTVHSGVIDLVFEEDDGWVMVDYKTDGDAEYARRKETYEKQLNLYAKFWERITSTKVKSALLFKI